MNRNFTFPARAPPVVATPRPPLENRDSGLRASVLDAALELGIGSSKTVANWMFNNTLDEEDEEEEQEDEIQSRGPLSPTSDESNALYSTPPTSTESHSEAISSPVVAPSPQVHFPPSPVTPAQGPNKLRKQRRENGYESDGYTSDGGKKARSRTKSKPTKPDPAAVFPISEPMELMPVSKEDRKRQKKSAKAAKDTGAETDTEDVKPTKPKSKKSKKTSTDAGYETDDGYTSSNGKSKNKRRFFGLRKKSESASDPPDIEPVPPMPEREVYDLPIASKFATSLAPSSAAPSAAPSRAETPLVPPTRPFAPASGSSTPSSTSSPLLTPADHDTFATASPRLIEDDVRAKPAEPISPQTAGGKSKFALFRSAEPTKAKQAPSPILLSPNPPSAAPNSRSASPGPSPMGSPFVLLTPINTSPYTRAHSPAQSEVVASADYIVPSRSVSPLPPSPNALANYDVPPPSPPPAGPLPRLPPPPSSMRAVSPVPGVERLRSMSQDHNQIRSVSPNTMSPTNGDRLASPLALSPGGGGVSPISPRGRAAPFPSQPILQSRPAPSPNGGLGLAERVRIQRYRDLYALQVPNAGVASRARQAKDDDETSVQIRVQEGSDDDDEGEMDDSEIAGVLGRFRQPSERDAAVGTAQALERNNSGALRPGVPMGRRVRFSPERSPTKENYSEEEDEDDDASRYPDDELTAGRRTMYMFDHDGSSDNDEASFNRDTVYSEYSRASFMDNSKSQAARGRLLDRVGVMFDESGRERAAAIPPVPKLPPELMGGATRF
uniref:Proteophosphoglycan ppg4 n=1 Tax=Mycena chlorophos TaxID=658473 RepID=A0ABQ0MCD4_MYCCL|nr:predicted protein [Mycena chlorophos]